MVFPNGHIIILPRGALVKSSVTDPGELLPLTFALQNYCKASETISKPFSGIVFFEISESKKLQMDKACAEHSLGLV